MNTIWLLAEVRDKPQLYLQWMMVTGQYLISNQYRSNVRAQTHKQNRKLPWTEIEVKLTGLFNPGLRS